MSTAASSTWPPEEFSVLFATDGDTAEIITDILAGIRSEAQIYSVIHNCYQPSKIVQETIKLVLCLPARRPGGVQKCLPILHIRLPTSEALAFLLYGRPLTANNLLTNICLNSAKETFQPLLKVIGSGNKASNKLTGSTSFKAQIHWLRAKFVTSFRKLYKIAPSPHWLITTFGQFEVPFVLVSCFYFFQDHECTVETIYHLARLYKVAKGQSLAAVNSFRELGSIFGTSEWVGEVPEFARYVAAKLARDDMESIQVDQTINEFRGRLMLSNQDMIHYIYLSFFQCYNRSNFLTYTTQTGPDALDQTPPDPILTQFIDDKFKQQMATYYNKKTYLDTHIQVKYENIVGINGYSPILTGPVARVWHGQAKEVQALVGGLNQAVPEWGFTEDLQGLLDASALEECDILPSFATSGHKTPVYRCEFLHKNFFLIPLEDGLEAFWQKHITLPSHTDWDIISDKNLTEHIGYHEHFFSMHSLREQIMVSRHEYFNPRLPVFNWVLDLDLPLEPAARSFEDIYSLCLLLRGEILDILSLLGPVSPDHPVYFFKSACPTLEWELMESYASTFCHCSTKLGLRIITRFPGYACVVGSDTMVSLTQILNRVVKMNQDIIKKYPLLNKTTDPFDTGIYHRGRCIRLPHTYKVGPAGELHRLLKIIVCHPPNTQKEQYIRGAFCLSNLLHHAAPPNPPLKITTFYTILDTNANFLAIRAKEQLPQSYANIVNRIETMTSLSITDWVEERVWPSLLQNIKLYIPDDKTSQFNHVYFSYSGGNIVQLKAQKGHNFKCLNFNHKSKSLSVRLFLILYANQATKVVITLMSQCFANKCQNNVPIAHLSTQIDIIAN